MNASTVTGIRGADRASTRRWVTAAFAVSLSIAAVILALRGAGPDGTGTALRATARWSYLWFWCAYAGGALGTLFGARFQPLARRARDFGLAFAAAQLSHAALVVWLYRISPQPPVSTRSLELFGFALFCTYGLALLSIRRVAPAPGSRLWPLVRTGAVEYIALAFLIDFLKNPFAGGIVNLLAYLPFLALAVAGPLLRLAARGKRVLERRAAGSAARGGDH